MIDIIRKPSYQLSERPFLIIWETTQACDLACRHCRADASPYIDPFAMTTEQAKNLLRDVESFGKPRPIFIFTGGDPFKRKDLFELVRYGNDLGIPCAVSPSGTPLLNRENLSKIRESGAKAISLSIDGSNREKHDAFRRVPGSFDWTVGGWMAARELALKVQINTTVTRYNLLDLPEIFRLVQKLGSLTWTLFFLVPTGRGKNEEEISPEEYEAVMHFLYDVSHYISAKTTEGHHYKRIVLQRTILERQGLDWEKELKPHPVYYVLREGLRKAVEEAKIPDARANIVRTPMHINAANGFVFISQRGEVFPSGFLPLSAGNVKKQSLVDIYRNSALFQNLRDPNHYEGRCHDCEFVSVCGGSRSRAYAVYGNPYAEEPYCSYIPGSFPYGADVVNLMSQEIPSHA